MPHIAQEPRPAVFFAERLAANVRRDCGVGPHRSAIGEIFQSMSSKQESFGF
jgi:hypothetical protein